VLGRPIGLVVAIAVVPDKDERHKANCEFTVKRNPSVNATTPVPLRPSAETAHRPDGTAPAATVASPLVIMLIAHSPLIRSDPM